MKYKIDDRVLYLGTYLGTITGERTDRYRIRFDDGKFFIAFDDELELVDDNNETPLSEQAPNPSEFISLDYRTEYHIKVAECEKLKAQVEFLWKQILGE